MQHYYQYQVVLKPAPANILELYLGSLEALGFDLKKTISVLLKTTGKTDTRRLGLGLGSMAERHGSDAVHLLPASRRYRLQSRSPAKSPTVWNVWRCTCRGVENVYDLVWTKGLSYGDVYHQNEVEQSTYNFEHSNADALFRHFGDYEAQAKNLMEQQLALPAYEQVLKAAHTFNLLDARGAISVTERAAYIGRIRNLARSVAQVYYESRERLGFPMAPREWVADLRRKLSQHEHQESPR